MELLDPGRHMSIFSRCLGKRDTPVLVARCGLVEEQPRRGRRRPRPGMMGGVADGGKGLVLVVEDERPIADLVRMYLTRDGFGVHVEYDGAAGLAAARKVRPVACVLDIALPGMDGTEICRRLRETGDWTPVLFLTARDDEIDRVLGLE